jgi:tRNA-specific adenosine deaminase 1
MVMESTDLANKISELCLNFYDKLPNSKRLQKETEWTILSAIVMQRNGCDFEIVAMGTGTKCIGANLLSANGNIINDSHAEIIARRAFLRFLIHQVSVTRGGTVESIFNFIENTKHFTLKDDVKFHMFTTSSPCGDASIFATSDIIEDEPDAKRIKLNNEGCQPDGFTGAKLMFDEDVEDPMDQIEGKIRIKPGKGDRTMSLSCSDKIARWNMVGIQGCMLASLIDPIYLSSIIFADGTPFNRVAMERALWKRFTHAEKIIAAPFRFHQPGILIAANKMKFAFTRSDKRVNPSSNSIIFTKVPDTMR